MSMEDSRSDTLCPDCGVSPGERHQEDCDVQICTVCFGQYMICQCPAHNADKAAWTGHWPGSLEAADKGWFVVWTEHGWISCDKDEPGSKSDLNRYSIFMDTGVDPGPRSIAHIAQDAYAAAKCIIMADEGQIKILEPDVWLGIRADVECCFLSPEYHWMTTMDKAKAIVGMRNQQTGLFNPNAKLSEFKPKMHILQDEA